MSSVLLARTTRVVGVIDVDAADLDHQPVGGRLDGHVWLAEDGAQVAGTGRIEQRVDHREIEGEATDEQDIDAATLERLLGRLLDLLGPHRPVLRPKADADPAGVALVVEVLTHRLEPLAGVSLHGPLTRTRLESS